MYTNSVASSSRLVTKEPWEGILGQFPTSNLRSVDINLRERTAPLASPLNTQCPPRGSDFVCDITNKYSNTVLQRTQIEPGVWSNGSDRVLSAACPDVQAFLTSARGDMVLPAAPSEPVFCLAALQVFYSVEDPVHWMFWNDDQKYQTAEIVNRISLHRPQLIKSHVAWNGTREYLFILSGLHGASSMPLFETKDWYPILNPSKASPPPRVLNLRKRKPQQIESLGDFLDEDDIDFDEPPAKRTKTNSSSNSAPPKNTNSRPSRTRREIVSPATTSISLPETHIVASCVVEEPQDIISSSSGEKKSHAPKRVRQRRRKTPQPSPPPSLTPGSSVSRASSPPSMLLTAPSLSHSRNRSTSQASTQTLVASRDRRSTSVLSAITAVEILTIRKEGSLGIKGENALSDCEDGDGDELGEPTSGMVTRGRANRVQKAEAKTDAATKRASRKREKGKSQAK